MNSQFPFRRFYLFVCSVTLFSFNFAISQQWEVCNGPFGGSITCFAYSGTDLYAGTEGGIFITSNNGQSWRAINNGLPTTYVSSIAVLGTKIFTGTSGEGLYVSTDKGDNWEKVYSIKNSYSYGLFVSGNRIFISTDVGTKFSDDEGDTWTLIQPALYAHSFSVSQNYLYAAVPKVGVFRSSDNGTSWTAINSGLSNLVVYNVYADGATVYAGVEMGGIFVSSNNGKTWKESNSGLPKYSSIYSITSIDNTVFISLFNDGVFKSSNNGASWTQVNVGLDSSSVDELIAVGSDLYAGCIVNGVYLSTNKGTSWKQMKNGITNIRAYPLAANGSTIYASTEINGFVQTKDEGNTWTPLALTINRHSNSTSYSSMYPTAVTTFGNNVIVGTKGNGLYVSKDNGVTWSESTNGLPENAFYNSFAVIGSTIFVGTDDEGIFRSSDTCGSWIQINNGITKPNIRCFATIGTKIFVATEQEGIFVSNDLGMNWKSANKGMANAAVSCMAAIGSRLFVGTEYYGVFQSTDYAENWTNMKDQYKLLQRDRCTSMAVVNNSLFVGTLDGNIFVTDDFGLSCYKSTMGLPKSFIYSLAVSGSKIYVGTSGNGIWKMDVSIYMDVHEKDNATTIPTLQIHPNPATNILTINCASNLFNSAIPIHFAITSHTGETLLETENTEPQFSISTELLSSGVYFLTARQGLQRSSTLFSILH